MRELALAGLIAVLAGLGSFYATDHFGAFSAVNLALGSALLLVALVRRARTLRATSGPHSRRVVLRGLAGIALALAAGVGLERAADRSGIRFDWTFEEIFEISAATRQACNALPQPVSALLFRDPEDPRIRQTRLLLGELARVCPGLRVEERVIDEAPDEADRYEVGTSNTVVLRVGDRFDSAPRPSEGAIFEALSRLRSLESGTIAVLRGEGEGDPTRSDDLGYSGLAAALATEGYRLRSVVSAAMDEVPEDTDVVLLIAPRRPLVPHASQALRRYLDEGGRLVALLEPGAETGIEELLADYGITSPAAVVVDPASGGVEEGPEGLNVIAFNYETHPISRGLDRNRVTYFTAARPFDLRRPRIDDELRRVVLSSGRAWRQEDLSLLERREGSIEHDGGPGDYQTLVASGRYPHEDGTDTRIVVFGDAGFASNRHLRAVYNLDLVLNAVHWATEREAAITLRPKIRQVLQFPVPLQSSVEALYGVGLLVPELLLIAGGIAWLRRRSS
jgi:hypothetical protein